MLTRVCKAEERRTGAKIAASVTDLESGDSWGWRENEQCPTASLVKLQILCALMERVKAGGIDEAEEVALRKRDIVGGSGILKNLTPGVALSLRDLSVLMMIVSDNTATNMLIDRLGLRAINAAIRDWGYSETVLWRKIDFRVDTRKPKWFGQSTPAETTDLLCRIARREFLGKRFDRRIEAVLADQKYDTALPRLLPGSGSWNDENPEIVVAHKTGSIDGARIDAGIVTAPFGRYAISVFVRGLKDGRYHSDNAGIMAIARVSRAVYGAMEKRA